MGCRFLLDDRRSRTEVLLNAPDRGLLIDRMVWHETDEFSPDCVLMVLATTGRHGQRNGRVLDVPIAGAGPSRRYGKGPVKVIRKPYRRSCRRVRQSPGSGPRERQYPGTPAEQTRRA